MQNAPRMHGRLAIQTWLLHVGASSPNQYVAVTPPSMRKSLPVMNAPSGPIRRAATFPTSSGVADMREANPLLDPAEASEDRATRRRVSEVHAPRPAPCFVGSGEINHHSSLGCFKSMPCDSPASWLRTDRARPAMNCFRSDAGKSRTSHHFPGATGFNPTVWLNLFMR